MYIVNGICYADKKNHEIRISSAEVLSEEVLLVTFNSGEQRIFDLSSISGSAFQSLKNSSVFADFTVQHGYISWMNGDIDIAPETVYAESTPYA